jgi:hypothetical protein
VQPPPPPVAPVAPPVQVVPPVPPPLALTPGGPSTGQPVDEEVVVRIPDVAVGQRSQPVLVTMTGPRIAAVVASIAVSAPFVVIDDGCTGTQLNDVTSTCTFHLVAAPVAAGPFSTLIHVEFKHFCTDAVGFCKPPGEFATTGNFHLVTSPIGSVLVWDTDLATTKAVRIAGTGTA